MAARSFGLDKSRERGCWGGGEREGGCVHQAVRASVWAGDEQPPGVRAGHGDASFEGMPVISWSPTLGEGNGQRGAGWEGMLLRSMSCQQP